jgi:hypothetical protein
MRQETDQFIVDQLDVPVGEAAEKLNHHLTHEVPDGYQLVGLDHTDSVDDQTWFLLWAKLVATPDLHATQAMVLQQEELLARRDEQISQHVMEKAELAAKLDEARSFLQKTRNVSQAFTLGKLRTQVDHQQTLLDSYQAQRESEGAWGALGLKGKHFDTGEWCKITSMNLQEGWIRLAPKEGVIAKQSLEQTELSTHSQDTSDASAEPA